MISLRWFEEIGVYELLNSGIDQAKFWRSSGVACLVVIMALLQLGLAALLASQNQAMNELQPYLEVIPWSYMLIIVPIALAGGAVLIRWPQLSIYALVFLLPFNSMGGTYFAGPLLTGAKILLNLFFVCSLICLFFSPTGWGRWIIATRLGISLAVFLSLLALAILIGLSLHHDRFDWARESNWMAFFAFALPVGTFLRNRRQITIVLILLTVAALFYQLVGFNYLITGNRYLRAEDWGGGADFIRTPFTEPMRFVLVWAIATLIDRWQRREPGKYQTMGLGVLILVLTVGLLASLGRDLIITTLISIGVILFYTPWNRQTVKALVIAIVLIGVSIPGISWLDSASSSSSGRWLENASDFALALFRGESVSSTIGRQEEVRHGINLWLESPIVGNGLGAPFETASYNNSALARFFTHNSYVNVLAKMGLLGLLAFLVLIFYCWVTLRRLLIAKPDIPDRAIPLSVMAYFIGVLLHALFGATVTTTDSVMFFAFIIGLVEVMRRLNPSSVKTQSMIPIRGSVAPAALVHAPRLSS